ncbi:MAG: VOC family protein [Rhodobacteraceae bacterium]|nr:MAG: VOC family protein [Paracoccaceae bacterium]
MLAPRISLVTLGVDDMARARAFYEALGLRAADLSSPEIAFFQLAGQALALYPRAALARDMKREALQPGSGAVTLAQNVESRDAVDALFAEMVAAGASPLRAPEPTDWGGYVAYAADPDGHVWEIAHAPMLPLADDGSLTLPEQAP